MSASDEQKARKLSISGREIFKAALSGEVVVLNPDDSVEEQELVSVVVNCLPLGVSFVPTRHLEMRVDGFVQDQEGKPYDVQASGRVTRGDLLHAVGDHSTGPDFGANAKLIQQSQFPITLHFRKQNLALGRYSLAELQEHCATDFKSWLPGYSREDRALLLQELILVEQAEDEKISLGAFVKRLLKDREHATLDSLASKVHHLSALLKDRTKTRSKEWKKQRGQYTTKMQSQTADLKIITKAIEKHEKQMKKGKIEPSEKELQNHIVLQRTFHRLTTEFEETKQSFLLPSHEGFQLRFGSEGSYIGLKDVWISKFYAQYSIEASAKTPQLVCQVPEGAHLNLRAFNVKLATEGLFPDIEFPVLNIDTEFRISVAMVWHEIKGWSCPSNQLLVKLSKFTYSEGNGGGKEHEVVMKFFVNQLLPEIVKQAVLGFVPEELGLLIMKGDVDFHCEGKVEINSGQNLVLIDTPLMKGDTKAYQALLLSNTHEVELLFQLLCKCTRDKKLHKLLPSKFSIAHLIGYLNGVTQQGGRSAWLATAWYWNQALDLDVFEMFGALEQLMAFPIQVLFSIDSATAHAELHACSNLAYTVYRHYMDKNYEAFAAASTDPGSWKDTDAYMRTIDDLYEKCTALLESATNHVRHVELEYQCVTTDDDSGKAQVDLSDVRCLGSLNLKEALEAIPVYFTYKVRPNVSDKDSDLIMFVEETPECGIFIEIQEASSGSENPGMVTTTVGHIRLSGVVAGFVDPQNIWYNHVTSPELSTGTHGRMEVKISDDRESIRLSLTRHSSDDTNPSLTKPIVYVRHSLSLLKTLSEVGFAKSVDPDIRDVMAKERPVILDELEAAKKKKGSIFSRRS